MIASGAELHFQWPGSLELLFRATLILAAAWAVHFALGGVNPRWRVTLWRAVSAALLVLPLTSAIAVTFPVELPGAIVQMGEYGFVPAVQQETRDFWNGIPWLELLWLGGASLFLLLLVRAHFKLARQVKSLSQADEAARELLTQVAQGVGYSGPLPDLRFSQSVEVPFACGMLKPVVVLPESMLAPGFKSELPAVLAHEVSHMRMADLAWSFIAQVVRCLLWFHPFARPVPDAHRAACEDVCNTAAAGYVGDVELYSKTLARVALATIHSPMMHGGIPMANRATVLQRLDFLKTGITARPLTKPAMGSFILLAVIALAGMSGLGLAMAAQQDKVPPLVDNAGYYFKANDGLQPPILKNESKAPRAMSGELKEAIRQAVERDGQIMVAVEVYVDETGKVNRQLTRVVTPSTCPAWDKAVLERYFEEEYYPALIDGKPVKYKSTSWLGTGNFARNNK